MMPAKVGVYRILHLDNLRDALERGLFAGNHPESPSDYRFIGHKRLTAQREEYPVPLPDGGTLGDYVPFYFGRLSIMLYNISTGHSVEKLPQEQIIYLLCSLDALDAAGCAYCFTDGHAKSNATKFFTQKSDLHNVDWALVNERYWQNTDADRDRQRRKQAELLVRHHVPPQCIEHIVVLGDDVLAAVQQLMNELNLSIPVSSRTAGDFYY